MRGILPDDWFFRTAKVPMTKAPVRAAMMGLLFPLEHNRVLEVGTGTGGMTVELARQVRGGGVVSLEPDLLAMRTAKENLLRARVLDRVRLIKGAAPECLPHEERFHAIVVGGHGNHLDEVLRSCWKLLMPGGRLLLSAVLLETAALAPGILENLGGKVGTWLLSPATGRQIEKRWMYLAQNPIYLFWADKPDNNENGRESV